MAQPAGQLLLDAGSPFYGYFWYANDTGLWDARVGAMATKTGTGAVTATGDGGANVANSDGSTSYTPATALSYGDVTTSTISFKVKETSAGDNGMVWGNMASAYFWLRASEIRYSGLTTGNSSPTSWATYTVVWLSNGTSRFYKNGVFVAAGTYVGITAITRLMAGYSGGMALSGAMEFFHFIPGLAASDAQVASLYADPYQALASGATNADATGAIAAVSLTAPSATAASSSPGSASGAVAQITLASPTATASAGATGTITISTPVAYKMHQRDASDVASIAITGTYTGSPASIEARFNSGAWATIVASPTGGSYSGTLTGCTAGQGVLDVRFADSTSVTASKSYIGVGDIYMVAGQSNNVGMATSIVDPSPSAFTAVEYDRSGTWRALTESVTIGAGFDSNAGQGSYFGALSNLLQAKGIPVALVPCAAGSTTISQWQRYTPAPYDTYFLYGNLLTRETAVGDHKALIFWQGESDTGTAQATYEAGLNQLIDDWFSDTGRGVFVVKICNWNGSAGTVRAAQSAVIASNIHVVGSADANVWTGGNVHYATTTQINDVAAAVYAGLLAAFYPVQVALTLTTDGSTPAASQSGIVWAWYDASPPDLSALPVASGTGATTDASGVFNIVLDDSSLAPGQIGTLVAMVTDGTPGSGANKAFCGPVEVA